MIEHHSCEPDPRSSTHPDLPEQMLRCFQSYADDMRASTPHQPPPSTGGPALSMSLILAGLPPAK